MKAHLRTLSAGLVVLACTSCTSADRAHFQHTPTLLGAAGGGATGGLLASQLSGGNPALTAAGALGGTLLGGAVGSLVAPKADPWQPVVKHAMDGPPGTVVPWNFPRTPRTPERHGTITSGVWGSDEAGPCRRFTLQIFVDDRMQTLEGCAVQQQDGTWHLRLPQ